MWRSPALWCYTMICTCDHDCWCFMYPLFARRYASSQTCIHTTAPSFFIFIIHQQQQNIDIFGFKWIDVIGAWQDKIRQLHGIMHVTVLVLLIFISILSCVWLLLLVWLVPVPCDLALKCRRRLYCLQLQLVMKLVLHLHHSLLGFSSPDELAQAFKHGSRTRFLKVGHISRFLRWLKTDSSFNHVVGHDTDMDSRHTQHRYTLTM